MKINRSVREILRTGSDGKCEKARLFYVVSDCTSAADAISGAEKIAPAKIDSATRQNIEITNSPGGEVFEVAVNYGVMDHTSQPRTTRRAGDRLWKFAVHGTSAECNTALETVRSIAVDGNSAADPGVLINWNGRHGQESAVGSVTILEPVFTEICRATFRVSGLNTAYKRRTAALVGKVNSDVFHHWMPGEVLLESIVQSEPFINSGGTELCDIVFTFAIRPNGTRSCAGCEVENVDGWDHLWAITGTPHGTTPPQVKSLHISRIYQRASFAALEI